MAAPAAVVILQCSECEADALVLELEPFEYGERSSAPQAGAAEGRSPAPSGATGD